MNTPFNITNSKSTTGAFSAFSSFTPNTSFSQTNNNKSPTFGGFGGNGLGATNNHSFGASNSGALNFGGNTSGNTSGFGSTNNPTFTSKIENNGLKAGNFGGSNAFSGFKNTQNNGVKKEQGVSEDYRKDVQMNESIVLKDTITNLKWIKSNNNDPLPIFAGTCWDKTVRIFEVVNNFGNYSINQRALIDIPQIATSLAWNNDNTAIFIGCVDGTIRVIDLNTMQINQVGQHKEGISSLNYISDKNVLISTAYDDKINFWQGNPQPAMTVSVDKKIFAADYSNNLLAGATADEKLFFIDINNIPNKTIIESSELGKYSPIQSISLDKKGATVGLTTVDGRCNISNLESTSTGYKTKSIITFKASKKDVQGQIVLFPTNTSSFNPFYDGWFLTGGGDGTITYWDYKARNKIKTFDFDNPVCHAEVSPKGDMVAYSLGNDWHLGEEGIGQWPNLLGVHLIDDQEKKFNSAKPKK